MTQAQRDRLNGFFVGTFNRVLTLEERALAGPGPGKGPSVREMHVIEAAAALKAQGRNTMSQVAALLGISVGALTTAVDALVRKGYLLRGPDPDDRRVVRISPTEAGKSANARHEAFHRDMLDQVGEALSEEDLEHLAQALDVLRKFFEQYAAKG
jgi:DNA-binding MarR family transcriptional regulator